MDKLKQTVREKVCDAISTTLRRSGRGVPEFKGGDRPLTDYEGMDSQCGLEVTIALEEELGIDDLGNNIFVRGTGKSVRAKSLSEVVNTIQTRLRAKNGRTP